jgi:DNA-directed RNA polymerase specialized sigma24 family protein
MSSERRVPRVRPIPPDVAAAAPESDLTTEAELLERLADALAGLPAAERRAAVVAFGLDEGSAGVAAGQELSDEDAEALTRSALQLLRGALADCDPDAPEEFARLVRRRAASPPAS